MDPNDVAARPSSYYVDCPACGTSFNALNAPWCSCLATERTLVCSGCGKCFCRAPRAYRQKFWSEAPPALWEAKLKEHRRTAEPVSNPPPESVRRPLILIVDDEAGIRRMAAKAAARLGFGVIEAGDGVEGRHLARSHRPEVILTDALMPRLEGREMCRRLKADPETRDIKVIVMTSLYKGQRYRSEALANFGADGYLGKPLDPVLLATTLRALVPTPENP
ncbi:MAG: response regulator [Thermoanaerobaculia bacterium]|nr:response regulator [Thermoanaerobaculia bacterium]